MLQILTVSLFEKIRMEQALSLTDYRETEAISGNLLTLFE
jgi:hypothetical protein